MPVEVNEAGEIVESRISRGFLNEATADLISREPGFLIRWGITIFFCILLVIGIICWFIQYPDVVNAQARLTSVNAPKPVITKTEGKLVKLFVTENQYVSQGTILGYVESIAAHEDVLQLETYLNNIADLLKDGKSILLPKYLQTTFSNLGELQQQYQAFMQAFITFRSFLPDGFYIRKKEMLNGDVNFLKQLHTKLEQEQELQQQDLTLTQKTFEANQSLKKEKVISDFDYRNEQSKLISKQLSLPQTNITIISNESQQHDKKKEIMDLENTIQQQEIIFLQALNILKNQIYDWKKRYLLIAPLDGHISFSGFFQENQQLRANQLICYVTPTNSLYYAEMLIPQYNFGKVKIGQMVQMNFIAYPNQEFGSVVSTVDFISSNPTDSGYMAKVLLPNGLKTNYHKQLPYREGLLATAQIITEKKRLLERFFENLKKITK